MDKLNEESFSLAGDFTSTLGDSSLELEVHDEDLLIGTVNFKVSLALCGSNFFEFFELVEESLGLSEDSELPFVDPVDSLSSVSTGISCCS